MKRYIGEPSEAGPGHVWVVDTETVGDTAEGTAISLTHRVHHSPDGFAWGYGGSGPADLARSILWDLLGAEPAYDTYQTFKFDVIAELPMREGFTLAEGEVWAWLKGYRQERSV